MIDENKIRVIKIGKEALFEFIYEKIIDNQEQYFDVDPLEVMECIILLKKLRMKNWLR